MKRNKIIYYVLAVAVVIGAYYSFRYFSPDTPLYYGFYNDVNGLQESSPIYLKGVKVGKIDDVTLQPDGKIKVALAIRNETPIPKGTVARIGADGISGGTAVFLKPGTGNPLSPNATLATAVDSAMADKFHARISPLIKTSVSMIRQTDSALSEFNYIVRGGWGVRTQQEVERFSKVLDNLAHGTTKANEGTQNLSSMMNSANDATSDPAGKNSKINDMLGKNETTVSNLRKKDIRGGLDKLATSLDKFSTAVSKTRNNKLLTDKAAYESTTKSLDTLNRSLKDMRDNPKGFTLFPKKK